MFPQFRPGAGTRHCPSQRYQVSGDAVFRSTVPWCMRRCSFRRCTGAEMRQSAKTCVSPAPTPVFDSFANSRIPERMRPAIEQALLTWSSLHRRASAKPPSNSIEERKRDVTVLHWALIDHLPIPKQSRNRRQKADMGLVPPHVGAGSAPGRFAGIVGCSGFGSSTVSSVPNWPRAALPAGLSGFSYKISPNPDNRCDATNCCSGLGGLDRDACCCRHPAPPSPGAFSGG